MYKLDNNVEWTEELKNAFKTGTTRAKIIYDGDKEINETNCLKQLELKDTQYVPGLGIIGQAVSKELSFSFVNKEGINLENQEVTLKIGAEYNGDVYYITYGNFIVYEAPKNDNTNEVTSVVANDYMKKFDILYEDSTTYPCTLRELTEDICQKVGVELGSESFTNEDFIVVDNQFEGKTAREVIQNVAKSAFSWARIGQDNKLYFDFEPSEEIEIVGSNFTITNANSMQQAEITEMLGDTIQEGTPTPSNPIEVQTVSGDNNIVVSNKNLFDSNKAQIGKAWNNTSNTARAIVIIKVEPNTKYTISFQSITGLELWWFGRANENDSTRTDGNYQITTSPTTITTNATTNYLGLQFNKTSIAQSDIDNCNIQLEKGTTATSYIAHQGNSYRVDLGGKNLFNYQATPTVNWRTTIVSAINNELVLKPEQNNNSYIAFDITVKSNTQYTLSVEDIIVENLGTWVGTCYVYEYNSGGTQHYITNMNNTNKIRTFTTQADTVRLRVQPYSLSGTVDTWENGQITWKEIMLCEGTDTNYSPYTANPIELCKIGNYQDKLLQSKGNNLFDKDNANILDAFVNGNTGLLATPTNNQKSIAVAIQPNTQYTISGVERSASNYGLFSDTTLEIGTSIATTKGQIRNGTMTFTSGASDKWLVFLLKGASEIYGYSNVMLNKGTTALPYEPYGVGKWYIEKQVGKVVLNGTENWNVNKTGTANWYYQLQNAVSNFNYDSDHSNYLSNIGVKGNVGNTTTTQGVYILSTGGLRVRYGTEDTVANWKAFLGTTNMLLYYPLLTPTYTEITDSYLLEQLNGLLDIELYENLCYVDWVGSIEPTMKLHYYSSTIFDEEITTHDYKLNLFKHANEYYGGINRVGYGDSDIEGQEEYVENAADIELNGLKDLFINDNLFAYTEAKRQALVLAGVKVLGFKYMPIQQLDLKGLIYLDCTDFLKIIDADGTELYSRCFDHTIQYQGYVSDIIRTVAPSEAQKTYENINASTLANTRTQVIVDKANKKITLAVEDAEEALGKATELEVTVDGISSTVNNLVDVTIEAETSTNLLEMGEINLSQPIKLTIHPIIESISAIYPRSTLFPSDTLFMTNNVVQFKRTYVEDGITKIEYIDYELPGSLLYKDSSTYDVFELDYDNKECKITKKLQWDANGNMIELATPQVIRYDYPYIELKDGEYEISIPGYETAYIYAVLMKKNEYTTKFATQVQMDTQIKQTENEVMIEVNQKVSEDEFTKAEIIARINSEGTSEAKISADSVSLEGYTTINGGFAVDEQGNASIANNSVMINEEGIQLANGRSIVGGNGMLTQFQYTATGRVGHLQGANTAHERIALYVPIYIPDNFIITDAKLFIVHTYAKVYEYTAGGYVEYPCYARNVKLYHTTERGQAAVSAGYIDDIAPLYPTTEVYNFGYNAGKTFSSNSVERVMASNIRPYLQSGTQYLYLADYANNPSDWVDSDRMSGLVDMSLFVTGYLQNNIE